MPPRSWRQLRAQRAAEARWQPSAIAIDPVRFAFSVLIEGVQPEQTLQTLEWNDIYVKNRQIYKAMRDIGDEIITLAEESMTIARNNMPNGCVIGFDGSWNHRRRGTNCLFTVICRQTGQVIESIIVSNKIEKTALNYCEHANLMEAHGLKLALPRLREYRQIVGYVHDNDGKARKIIEDSGWGIREYLDPGHALKCFEKRLKKLNKQYPRLLRGIEKSLTKWLRALIRYDDTTERKIELWTNCYRHYMGDHTLCLHEDRPFKIWDRAADPDAITQFKSFLDSTKFIIEYCTTEFDTQSNESLHKLKLKYATKDIKWGNSWKARMMCAVLDRNMNNWKFYLYNKLGLPPLSPAAEIRLKHAELKRITRKLYVHSEEYRQLQHQQRKMRRQQEKRLRAEQQRLAYGI